MDKINLGPAGCWNAAFILAMIGAIAAIVMIGIGVIWIINHVFIL